MSACEDGPVTGEFELPDLELSWSDTIETDDDGLAWLAEHELPPNIEGVDYGPGAR